MAKTAVFAIDPDLVIVCPFLRRYCCNAATVAAAVPQ
jgi:hypothetical protein